MTQVKKHALKERLRVLEDENAELKHKIESENSMLIKKEDHKAFVSKLHEMHKQEIAKIQGECEALYKTIDELVTGSEHLKDEIKSLEALVEKSKKEKVNIHNELQYKKLENEKLIADRVETKLAADNAMQAMVKRYDGQKAVYDEKIAKLENQISLKDIQVE